MTRRRSTLLTVLALSAAIGALHGCGDRPAEKAGKAVDNAVEKAGDEVGTALNKAGDAVKDVTKTTKP